MDSKVLMSHSSFQENYEQFMAAGRKRGVIVFTCISSGELLLFHWTYPGAWPWLNRVAHKTKNSVDVEAGRWKRSYLSFVFLILIQARVNWIEASPIEKKYLQIDLYVSLLDNFQLVTDTGGFSQMLECQL